MRTPDFVSLFEQPARAARYRFPKAAADGVTGLPHHVVATIRGDHSNEYANDVRVCIVDAIIRTKRTQFRTCNYIFRAVQPPVAETAFVSALHSLMRDNVVHSIKRTRTADKTLFYLLTVTPFLCEALAKPPSAPVRAPYVRTPDYWKDPRFAMPRPPNGPKWGRPLMKKSALLALKEASLREIHPRYDDTHEGAKCIVLFDIIAFGPREDCTDDDDDGDEQDGCDQEEDDADDDGGYQEDGAGDDDDDCDQENEDDGAGDDGVRDQEDDDSAGDDDDDDDCDQEDERDDGDYDDDDDEQPERGGAAGAVASLGADMRCPRRTYGDIVRSAAEEGIDRALVDKLLSDMLKRSVLHVKMRRAAWLIFALPFLNVAHLVPKEVDPKPLIRITMPDYFANYPPPERLPFAKKRSRPLMTHDVRVALHHDSLVRIHPDYDGAEGKERIQVYNFIAFGFLRDADGNDVYRSPPSGMTFRRIVTACTKIFIPRERTEAHLRALFESQAMFSNVSATRSTCAIATPFLTRARLATRKRDRNEKRYANWRKERSRQKKKRLPRSQIEEDRRKVISDGMAERAAKRVRIGNVDLRANKCCIGYNGEPCCKGPNGEPVVVDPDTWQLKFGISSMACEVPRRALQCLECSKAHSALRRSQNEHSVALAAISSFIGNHTDGTQPSAPMKLLLMAMLEEATECALCGGDFDEEVKYVGTTKGPQRPWARSFSPSAPEVQNRFASIDEIPGNVAVVHLVCNYAHHKYALEEVRQVCRYVANRVRTDADGEFCATRGHTECATVVSVNDSTQKHFYNRGRHHGLKRSDTSDIARATFLSPDPMTGLTFGYGSDFDIDLREEAIVHPLLRVTIDQINSFDETPGGTPISNFRVVLCLFNWVRNCFPDVVLEKWLALIVRRYKSSA